MPSKHHRFFHWPAHNYRLSRHNRGVQVTTYKANRAGLTALITGDSQDGFSLTIRLASRISPGRHIKGKDKEFSWEGPALIILRVRLSNHPIAV